MPAPYTAADPVRMQNRIRDILNASPTWAAVVTDKKRSEDAITAARIESGFEVLRAISRNQQHGYHGQLCTLVLINHDTFMPAYDGEPGLPLIVPFFEADKRTGIEADADEIDSYIMEAPDKGMFTGGMADGNVTAHNEPDENGMMSPVACFYNITAGRFKFTGYSAEVPLIVLTREMADSWIPESLEPAVIKLTPAKLIKPGDALFTVTGQYARLGAQDLVEIEGGALKVPPVPNITLAQKQL